MDVATKLTGATKFAGFSAAAATCAALVSFSACSSAHGENADLSDSAAASEGGADSDGDSDGGLAAPPAIALKGCGVNYTTTVTLGGSQPFTFILDTGSSITGVGGSTCASCVDGGVKPLYTPGANATDTQKATSESFANTTGWSGEIYTDTAQVGAEAPANVNFVDITSQNDFFSALDGYCGASITGILGLGPSALLYPGTTSYLDALKSAGNPDVFSFQLCPNSGSLWLGGYDPKYAPQFAPMVSGQKFYTVQMTSIDVAGSNLNLPTTDFGDAFVDTGGDALWLPPDAFNAIVAAIGSDANFTKLFGNATTFFSTSSQSCITPTQTSAELDAMLPALTLNFGGGVTVQAPATSSYLLNLKGCGYTAALFTRGANNDGLPAIEMGAPILHDKVVVIDRAQKQIGFAPAPCQ